MKCPKLLAGTSEGLLEDPHQLIVIGLLKFIVSVSPSRTRDLKR
jgi:hypothetical protein